MQFYTGQRAQVVGTGEFVTIVQVIPSTNICVGERLVVRDSNDSERTYSEAFLRVEDPDVDPFDNPDDGWLEQAFEDRMGGDL